MFTLQLSFLTKGNGAYLITHIVRHLFTTMVTQYIDGI